MFELAMKHTDLSEHNIVKQDDWTLITDSDQSLN